MSDALPNATIVSVARGVDAEAERLRDARWSVQRGFVLPERPWDVRDDRRVCVGVIDGERAAEAALLAAARGASLVVAVAGIDAAAAARFLDDLGRVADVTRREPSAPALPLDDVQQRLLRSIGDGRTMAEAAAEQFLSLRTAERKLGAARKALGVATTAEAVATLRAQQ
jgi:DNA-binding CsgD family transcriptional regulator